MDSGQTNPKPKRHRIRAPHQEDLRWYFSTGIRQFEQGSSFGAQIERLCLYGEHARPCKDCGGDPKTNRPGSGFILDSKEWREKRALAWLLDKRLAIPGDITCQSCKGKGWISGARRRNRGPLTAKPTHSSVRGNGVPETGGSASMARLGMVSRWINRVREMSPIAASALELYFDPSGGSAGCLWGLTPAGRKMLGENGHKLPERQFFENLRDAHYRNPTDKRRRQFEAADRQARELLEHMHEVWCRAVGDVEEAA